MSWLSAGLDTLNQLTETVAKASESVKQAIPVDKDLLAKLTLNTDEMKAQRQMFGDEANRKAEVKNMLAGMLPWETKDSERDILVDECREAILALSTDEETFFGPYEMPSLPVKVKRNAAKEIIEGDDEEEDEEVVDDHDGGEGDDEDEDEEEPTTHKPSEASLEKLAKLEPLPPLLRDFDLDSHVGLIQNILKEDPNLVHVQSTLSGGGAREKVFWHNYFFHCAYTRYQAGLSIDEIWSFQPDSETAEEVAAPAVEENAAEETVIFDNKGDVEEKTSPAFVPDETTGGEASASGGDDSNFGSTSDISPPGSSGFELVDDGLDVGVGDPELDELEAEIARELED